MDFRRLVWRRVGKIKFFGLRNRVKIWGTGRHTPAKNSQEYPTPPPPSDYGMCKWRIIQKLIILSKVNVNLIKRVELKSVTGNDFGLLRNTVGFSTIIT